MTRNKIIHFHLPKTGGTALRHYFVEHLGSNDVAWPPHTMMLSEALVQWQDVAVITGHFMATQGDELPPDRVGVIVLRNPIERFLSEFQYNKLHLMHQLVDARQRASDLDTYLGHLQTTKADTASTQIEMLFPLGTALQRRLTADEKLAAARTAIDRFDLVGTQENMVDFSYMICATMDWQPKNIAQKNVTSKRLHWDTLDPEQRASIQELLEPELELYNYALARFKSDRQQFITGQHHLCSASRVSSHRPKHTADEAALGSAAMMQTGDFGDLRAQIISVQIAGTASGLGQVMCGEQMDIVVELVVHEKLDSVTIGMAIKNEQGLLIFGTNSSMLGTVYELVPGKYTARFTMLNRIGPGHFAMDVALTCTASHYDDCFHWRRNVVEFDVHAYASEHFDGRTLMDADLQLENSSPEASWTVNQSAQRHLSVRAFGRINPPITDFRAKIESMSAIDLVNCAVDAMVQVKLVNTSGETWAASGRCPVRLSYRWAAMNDEIVEMDGLRTALPHDVPTGGSAIVPLHIRTPKYSGEARLIISLVQEGVAWFVDMNQATACILPITLNP